MPLIQRNPPLQYPFLTCAGSLLLHPIPKCKLQHNLWRCSGKFSCKLGHASNLFLANEFQKYKWNVNVPISEEISIGYKNVFPVKEMWLPWDILSLQI